MSSGSFLQRRHFLGLLGVFCGSVLLPVFSTQSARSAPQKTALKSSVLAFVQYDEAKQTLEIEFQTGAIYRYEKVPRETYDALLAADSKGRFFSQHIRNDFAAARVR